MPLDGVDDLRGVHFRVDFRDRDRVLPEHRPRGVDAEIGADDRRGGVPELVGVPRFNPGLPACPLDAATIGIRVVAFTRGTFGLRLAVRAGEVATRQGGYPRHGTGREHLRHGVAWGEEELVNGLRAENPAQDRLRTRAEVQGARLTVVGRLVLIERGRPCFAARVDVRSSKAQYFSGPCAGE